MPTADDAHPVTRTPAASQSGHGQGQGARTIGDQLTLLAVVLTGAFMAMLDTTIVPAPVHCTRRTHETAAGRQKFWDICQQLTGQATAPGRPVADSGAGGVQPAWRAAGLGLW